MKKIYDSEEPARPTLRQGDIVHQGGGLVLEILQTALGVLRAFALGSTGRFSDKDPNTAEFWEAYKIDTVIRGIKRNHRGGYTFYDYEGSNTIYTNKKPELPDLLTGDVVFLGGNPSPFVVVAGPDCAQFLVGDGFRWAAIRHADIVKVYRGDAATARVTIVDEGRMHLFQT